MTAHELAKYLLEKCPDIPVVINGWGSDEGCDFTVEGAYVEEKTNLLVLGHGTRKYPKGRDSYWVDWGMPEPKL